MKSTKVVPIGLQPSKARIEVKTTTTELEVLWALSIGHSDAMDFCTYGVPSPESMVKGDIPAPAWQAVLAPSSSVTERPTYWIMIKLTQRDGCAKDLLGRICCNHMVCRLKPPVPLN